MKVSSWFLLPTPGRNVKLPSALIVAVPIPLVVTVSATAETVCGNVASWSVSLDVRTLPVRTTLGPVPVVPRTASVFPDGAAVGVWAGDRRVVDVVDR